MARPFMKPGEKSVATSIRLPVSEMDVLRDQAEKLGIPLASYIRMTLKAHIDLIGSG